MVRIGTGREDGRDFILGARLPRRRLPPPDPDPCRGIPSHPFGPRPASSTLNAESLTGFREMADLLPEPSPRCLGRSC